MKKIIVVFIFFVPYTLLFADVIEKTYYFNSPEIAAVKGFQQITFDDCMLTSPAGEPVMPYKSVALLLPPGQVATGIQVIPGEIIPLIGKFIIYPMQHARPLSVGESGIFAKNEEIYSKNADYPKKLYGEITTQFLHGFAIAICSFTPLKFNPVSEKVSYYQSITVRIETKPNPKALAALINLNTAGNAISQLFEFVQNSDAISSYPKKATEMKLMICSILHPRPSPMNLMNCWIFTFHGDSSHS